MQKAARNEQQYAGFHLSCSLLGDGVRGVCPCGNGKCKDFAATPVVACVQMGEASKTRNATTKARRSTFQKVPARIRGTLCTALRAALQLLADRESPMHELRGWKLFCLAPRLLLHRSGQRAAGRQGEGSGRTGACRLQAGERTLGASSRTCDAHLHQSPPLLPALREENTESGPAAQGVVMEPAT